LLAVDLDGTLLGFDLSLDPRDVEAVGRAVAAGMHVIACTGRPFPGARPWVEKLGLVDPFVCYQGAQVRSLDGGTLLESGVPHDRAMEVITFCRERDLHVQAYRDDKLLVERDRPEAQQYAQHAGMAITFVPDLEAAMGDYTPKLVIIATVAKIEELLPVVRERWRGVLYAATSMPDYLEITNPKADKRQALEYLSGRLGVSARDSVAVGDGRNDLPMIEWAALGVAVEGAPAEVLAAADRVIPRPGQGGIAVLVDELLKA
jgi:Cof subfamily protein (haloacid dehalogenase superfamily)